MGLLVERHAAIAVNQPRGKGGLLVHFVNVGRHVVKTLRPEEKAVPGIPFPGWGQILSQHGVGGPGGEIEIPGAALRVEAAGHGDSLQQGGFPRPVLPHQEGDGPVEVQDTALY